ncbi:homoserine dehydrogenase [Methanobrevibacter sp. 87.7]|uniref:homoserine dehydrogenase n=1 Tax=Methanobrevibacter sp. 87.7 TaxID=387957 RepID=UPI000B501455|nr:homoserine dehydrogenase [Methanobrevibacter sp. 87.7]OWT32610.1 homoserine dehydrogenase [Methanobrevibacter sp. 87.7]
MKDLKLCIMGFGAVGQGLAKVVSLKRESIKQDYGVNLKIVSVADSSTSAICEDGLDEDKLINIKEETGKVGNYPEYGSNISGLDVLDACDFDVLMEATPTNIKDAEPARSLTLKAFDMGKDVVTSNKGHLALDFKELMDSAKKNNVLFKFEASVGGTMPIINLAQETLPANDIKSIVGILNGTTNYILSRMTSEGTSYENTLKESQQLGIAETDPTQDVMGIDAACKTVILANALLGIPATYDDVKVKGISEITSEAISLAGKEGYLIKLIAEISPNNLEVSPRLVRKGSVYDINGTLNMANLKTDLSGDVTVMGIGAGSVETAAAMLTDLIHVIREKY